MGTLISHASHTLLVPEVVRANLEPCMKYSAILGRLFRWVLAPKISSRGDPAICVEMVKRSSVGGEAKNDMSDKKKVRSVIKVARTAKKQEQLAKLLEGNAELAGKVLEGWFGACQRGPVGARHQGYFRACQPRAVERKPTEKHENTENTRKRWKSAATCAKHPKNTQNIALNPKTKP